MPLTSFEQTAGLCYHSRMSPRVWIVVGSVLAAAGVAAGAYHAHGLEKRLTAALLRAEPPPGEPVSSASAESLNSLQQAELSKRMGYWDTATRYQMYHALGLVLVGLLAECRQTRWTTTAGLCMCVGVALFSGLLDVMAFGGPRWLGAIVPLGGLSMIAGWLTLACAALSKDRLAVSR